MDSDDITEVPLKMRRKVYEKREDQTRALKKAYFCALVMIFVALIFPF